MNPVASDILVHYGVKYRSGRYPYGSGENPFQHCGDFLSYVDEMRKAGITYTDPETGKTYTGDTAIAKTLNLSTTAFRTQIGLAKDERRQLMYDRAVSLKEKGYSNAAIGREMGIGESSVRSLLNKKSAARMQIARSTADVLRDAIDENGIIDVGAGVERQLGVSRQRFDEALAILQMEGYDVVGGRLDQLTNPGKKTTYKVILPEGTEHKEMFNPENIHYIDDATDLVSHDGGDTFDPKWVYPKSMDSSRLEINYAEDGGIKKDGLVEIRRNVADLSLGESRYSQVRILVDDNYYIKGMAVYSDDLPPGVDVRFNTNKKIGTPMNKVLKEIHTEDPDNPFGSLIKEGINDPDNPTNKRGGQSYYYDENGEKQLSLINKPREEGDWGEWADTLPSQFLAKQSKKLMKQQINLSLEDKQGELNDILELSNPTVKKALLESYADDCDAAAVHLSAAALPRQKYQVLIPLTTISDNEIYAPNYADGETVALVRYPHGGTFEIPILKVNNKLAEGKQVLTENPADAVGINSKVAERLSGADFDGDTVMVIPCNSSSSSVKIVSTPPLKTLEGFDPKLEYGTTKKDDGYYNSSGLKIKEMTNTQKEMGMVSNLITDMTLKGATDDELAKAVKHSMVVIDAAKHHLDYKQSEKDNDIATLKERYQAQIDPETGRKHYGASTLLSKAKSESSIVKTKGSPKIDPETGKKYYETATDPYYTVAKINKDSKEEANATVNVSSKGNTYVVFDDDETQTWVPIKGKSSVESGTRVNATSEVKTRTQKSTKMADTDDAYTLVSDYHAQAELIYADYANSLKSLANTARKESLSAGKIEYQSSAAKTYTNEVQELKSALNIAKSNAPKERQAQALASARVNAKKQSNPQLTLPQNKSALKKLKQQELTKARTDVGAKRTNISITDKQWEAIQAGAISENLLKQILVYADMDSVKQKAMPRASNKLSNAQQRRLKSLSAKGYTTEQIARSLGISTSTVNKYLNEE